MLLYISCYFFIFFHIVNDLCALMRLGWNYNFLYNGADDKFSFFLGYNRENKIFLQKHLDLWRRDGGGGSLRYLLKWWLFFTGKKITAHLSTLYSRDNAWKENGGLLFRSDMPNVMIYCCMIKSLTQISLPSCVHWKASQEFVQNRKW